MKKFAHLCGDVNRRKNENSGFTLIEILVVIGIIAVLAAIVIIAINPARQFAQARNTQRTSNVEAILNAIGQRIADNKGLFREPSDIVCTMDISSSLIQTIKSGTAATDIDLRPCLVPTYMSELPVDPSIGIMNSATNYNTGYSVTRDPTSGRITVAAPYASSTTSELNQVISLTR